MLRSVPLLGAFAFSLFSLSNAAIGPVADMVIVNKEVSPDGFSRPAALAGGTLPGVVIKGNKGDRFQLNVIDQLTDDRMLRSTTIHWHGIYQKGTNFADGAAFVTQCPIAANDSFLYDFTVLNQAGTYWYHSHLSTQYCDGLRGAFVIYDPNDPYKWMYDVDDDSTIITLEDWYHVTARSVGMFPPESASTLINGKGRYHGGPAAPLAVVNVKQFKRYRFRIIAMSCDPNFTFSIDGHNLTVIEADGEATLPLIVDSIQIHAGQRYSAVLMAFQPIGNYWIRADPNDLRGLPGFDGGRNSAILRYAGAPAVDPTTPLKPSVRPLREIDLHPLTNPLPPGKPWVGGADVVLNIAHKFDFDLFKYTMNGHPFNPPSVPVLLQIMSGAQTAQDLLPTGSYYALPANKVIEISFPGTGIEVGGPHPFHLHGHTFSVIRSGDSDKYNFINPVRRDTVNTGLEGGNATIRFKTDNAGPWFLHCHIDWHLELGLAVVFAEDLPNTAAQNTPPPAWDALCPKYDSLTPDQL